MGQTAAFAGETLYHRWKSRVEDWLLGSVPKRVSSYAPCHVIIVK